MKALSLFLRFVLPHAYGCSDPLAEQAILSACIELANTGIVQTIVDDATIVGEPDYDVSAPSSTRLLRVMSVHYLNTQLVSRALDNVTSGVALRGQAVGTASIANGTPTEWFMRDPAGATVSIYPPPDTAVAGGLTFRMSVVPARAATSVPDVLYEDYAEEVACGALARLLRMPNQPFTAPKAAEEYDKDFKRALGAAASLARTGPVSGALRVRPRAFA